MSPIRASAPSRSAAISARRSPSPRVSTMPKASAVGDHGRRSAASARTDRKLRRTLARRLQECLRHSASTATPRRRCGACCASLLPAVRRLRRNARCREGAGDFRLLDAKPSRRCAPCASTRVSRRAFTPGSDSRSIGVPFDVAPRAAGTVEIQLSQAHPFRARRAHVVLDHAAARSGAMSGTMISMLRAGSWPSTI